VGTPGYIPPITEPVTLEPPELPVHLERQTPASLRQVLERDLTPETLAGRTAPPQRSAVPYSHRIVIHGEVEVLAWFPAGEKALENDGVAFGGHAAGVVASEVAGHAVRQQTLPPVCEAHGIIIPERIDHVGGRGQNSSSST
jgi:hypothetical protein